MSDWKIVDDNPTSDWKLVGDNASAPSSDWRIVDDNSVAEKTPWYDSPWMSAATGFNKAVEDTTHGLLQPLLESGYLGERVRDASRNVANQRNIRYEQAREKDPRAALLGNIGGNVALAVPTTLAGGVGATAAARYIPALGRMGASMAPNAPSYLRYLGNILRSDITKGGLTGAAQGFSQYVSPDESRIKNALIGGTIGSALGGATSTLKAGGGLIGAYSKTHPAEMFGKKFIENMRGVESDYSQAYKSFLKKAAGDVELPAIKAKSILTGEGKGAAKETAALRMFLAKPTVNNAHRAQSDLGKMITRYNKKQNISTPELNALNSAKKAQNQLRSAITDSLEKKGDKQLAQVYKDLTDGYARDVIPYKVSSPVSAFSKKRPELTPEDFRKAIAGDKKFKALLGEELYPELYKLPKIGKVGAGLAAAIAGASFGPKFGMDLLGQ